jgi:hypothetical protein
LQSDPSIPSELRAQLDACGPTDLLVGIPSFNNADTIGEVVRAVQAGLAEFFPGIRAAIVNSDGGSTDGTPEVVREAAQDSSPPLLAMHPVYPIHQVATPYYGIPGKASALRTVLAVAGQLEARACAVVDADVKSIEPSWVDLLLSPVLGGGFDFVAPQYFRHKYDGTINNSIVYPLTRSLYGQRIRQPIGGDFGFSGRLGHHYLGQDVWESELARFGIDAWMTTTAITGGFRLCQTFLGPRIHDPRGPSPAISGMLSQVVGPVFDLMERHADMWKGVQGSASVPQFGEEHAVGLEPVRVDTARMIRAFQRGVRELEGVWGPILEPDAIRELGRIGVWDPSRFLFPPELWVRVLHAFAVAYHRRVMDREHLLQALTPIYQGWVASFVTETRNATAEELEAREEWMCLLFERLKPELSRQWDTGKEDP